MKMNPSYDKMKLKIQEGSDFMTKITAILMSLLTTLSLFLGTAGSADYQKQSGLSEAVKSLTDKTSILAAEYKGAVSDYVWTADEEYKLENTVVLKKEKNKDFVILNITDTHFADYDYRAFTAFDVEAKLKALVASVKPDLITVSGDIVCTDSTYYSIRRITDLFESFGIPWAPMFGNHDGEGNCDKNFLADIMMSSPNCLMIKGDPDMGVGNYIINIAEDNDDGTLNVVESLIIMDCRPMDVRKQISWYRWAADGINEITGKTAEISIFTHIPYAEYQYAYDAAWDEENGKWHEGFDAYGESNESICFDNSENGPVYQGLFEEVKNSETTKFIFCGHEHLNNFSILYEGVRLTYCLKIGMGSGYEFRFSGGTEIRVGSVGINRIMHKTLSFGIPVAIEDIKI